MLRNAHPSLSAMAAAIVLLATASAASATTFTWSNGNFVSGTTAPNPLAAGDQLLLQTNSQKRFDAVSFVNDGSVVWQAGGVRGNNATLTNNGLWDVRGDLAMDSFNLGSASFVNNGSLRKSAGSGNAVIGQSADFAFVHNGNIDVQTGMLRLAGVTAINSGATFTGSGAVDLRGTSTVNGAFNIADLRFGGSGTHTGNVAVVNGSATWTIGTLTGSWGNTAASTWTLNTGGATFNARVDGAGSVFTNRGSMLVTATTAGLVVSNGARFVNDGLFDLQGNASHVSSSSVGSFVNNGTLRKSAGSISTFGSFGIVNNGVIDARVGTIQFNDRLENGGTLMGSSTIVASGGIGNNARIAPGADAATGTLALSGTFSQAASGSLLIDLTSPGSHDLLNVNGTAFLGGTLALHCLGACRYAVGDTITILDATGNLAGSFASVTLAGFATGAFNVVYDDVLDQVRLQVTQAVTAAVPEPGTWALLLAGLAAVGGLARRRRV